jgi:hypothetical protein
MIDHYWQSKLLQFRHHASPKFTKQLMTLVSSANAYGEIAQRKKFNVPSVPKNTSTETHSAMAT